MIRIRQFEASDWSTTWQIIEPVFRAGETYPQSLGITEAHAYHAWITLPSATYAALDDSNRIVGTYYIKPNSPPSGPMYATVATLLMSTHAVRALPPPCANIHNARRLNGDTGQCKTTS